VNVELEIKKIKSFNLNICKNKQGLKQICTLMNTKSVKKPTLLSPRLPHINATQSIGTARSLTEAIDPSLSMIGPSVNQVNSPLSTSKKFHGLNLKDSALLSPRESQKIEKKMKSMHIMTSMNKLDYTQPNSIHFSGGTKMMASTVKNFHSNAASAYASAAEDRHHEKKKSSKIPSIMKKKEEILSSRVWNEDQQKLLKNMVYYFQESSNRITDLDGVESAIAQVLANAENAAYSLIGSLGQVIEANNREVRSLTNKVITVQEALKNIEASFKSKNKMEFERLEKLKKDIEKSEKSKELNENSNYFFIEKLTNENEFLKDKLQNLIDLQEFKKLTEELELARANSRLKTEQYETELKDREVLLTRYEIMYSGTRKMNDELGEQNKQCELKIMRLEEEIEMHKKSYTDLEEERDMYRERGLMQLAEFESLQLHCEGLQENLEKMKDKYFNERKRGEQLQRQNTNDRLEELNAFGNEVKAFQYVKSILYTTPGKSLNFKRDTPSLNDADKEQEKEKEKEKEKASQKKDRLATEVDPKNYLIAKPTYLFLFQKQKLYLKMNSVKFTNDFIATLRAIYDSKYNEYLYADNYTQISRFPDFVYSWMGKFVVDPMTRTIRTADIKDPDPEVLRNELIVLFHNPMVSRLWECIVFKEFLEEMHTRDELIYFLQCRQVLFRGPQLNDPSSTFTYSYYVRYEWVEIVIEKLLGHKHHKETIQLIKSRIKERARKKKDKLLVDSVFFLRVMLEEYKKEKMERFGQLKTALLDDQDHETMGPASKSRVTIHFDSFKDFITNYYPEVYDIEKAELYRKCWIYSNGVVDVDSILMVLNEENFFTRVMKFPHLDDRFVPKCANPSEQVHLTKIYDFVSKQYERIDKDIDFVQDASAKLGVEKFTGDLFDFDKKIKYHIRMDGRGFQGKDIHLSMAAFSVHIYKLSHLLLHLDDVGKEIYINVQNDLGEVFANIRHTLRGLMLLQDTELKEFETNVKAKKLQKFFRSKISSWYKLMNFILKNKLKRYIGQ